MAIMTDTELPAAKAFYAAVWGWSFNPNPPGDTRYTDDSLAMFTYPGEKLMGGIKKVDEACIRQAKGGVMVYLYAESIEDQIEVCYLQQNILSSADDWIDPENQEREG